MLAVVGLLGIALILISRRSG
ncbi:MAG: hypothetical protein ACXV3D_05495 [Halobacteriota archaeon]